jgi:double-stranded uracil-DNA glycosylase
MVDRSADARACSTGFPPVACLSARVLILGSLPGVRSLEAQEYYAQPQNAFWRIMDALIGAGPDLEYAKRLDRLRESGFALWDVIHAAVRAGSMDSAIERATIVPNDFAGFLATHDGIRLVCFNGRTAAELWRKKVVPTLAAEHAAIETRTLPSTSPAYAGMPFAEKLGCWHAVLGSSRRSHAAAREASSLTR